MNGWWILLASVLGVFLWAGLIEVIARAIYVMARVMG